MCSRGSPSAVPLTTSCRAFRGGEVSWQISTRVRPWTPTRCIASRSSAPLPADPLGRCFPAKALLRDCLGDRFAGGFVLNLGELAYRKEQRIMVMPLSGLWSLASSEGVPVVTAKVV